MAPRIGKLPGKPGDALSPPPSPPPQKKNARNSETRIRVPTFRSRVRGFRSPITVTTAMHTATATCAEGLIVYLHSLPCSFMFGRH